MEKQSDKKYEHVFEVLEDMPHIRNSLLLCYLSVNEIRLAGQKDAVTKFMANVRLRRAAFPFVPTYKLKDSWVWDTFDEACKDFPKFPTLLRDFAEYVHEQYENSPNLEMKDVDEMITSYYAFKKDVNTVSDDVSKEVDRLAEMTDEEFEAEMAKEDEDDEDDDDHQSEDMGSVDVGEESNVDAGGPESDLGEKEANPDEVDKGTHDGVIESTPTTEKPAGIQMTIINPKKTIPVRVVKPEGEKVINWDPELPVSKIDKK